VTLIDMENFFEFTPGVLRTIVEPEHIKKIQVLHNHYLKRAKILVGGAKEITDGAVHFDHKEIKYDYLIIAAGSSYDAPFKEQRVVVATRAGHLKSYYNALRKARKILIVGGGLVGVEMAGEICDHYKDKEITIVHSGERLISRNSKKAIDYAENFMKKSGVKILFGKRMVGKKGRYCILSGGERVKADLVFLCTGITPNFSFMKGSFRECLSERNQIKVDKYFRLIGKKNVFAAGDLTDVKEEKTAQNAERHAEVIVHNICSLEFGGELSEYEHKSTPMLISLGKYNGIFNGKKIVFGGLFPAMMKWGIERWEMMKKRRVG